MFVLGCSGVRLLGSGVPPRVLMLGVCVRVLGFGCSESGVRIGVSGFKFKSFGGEVRVTVFGC